MTFRFLHVADLHLDDPFDGVDATSPEVAAVLREASVDTFDALVRLAITRDVAFVVLAGGIYRGPDHGVRAQLELRRGLGELADRGIATFLALGPDDPVDQGWTAVRDWPDLVTIFPADQPRSVPVERDGVVVATVHGISHGSRSVTDDLASRLARTEHPGLQVGVVAASVDGASRDSTAAPTTLDVLVGSGLDYWALGHADSAAILHTAPWVVYPGTPQARRGGPGGIGPKGGYLVEVDDDGAIAAPEFVTLDRVRFDRLEHPIDGIADLATLRDRLVDRGRSLLAGAADRSVLVHLELVGRGPVHGELHRPGTIAELVDTLRSESLTDAPLLWWSTINVATRGVQELTELQGRNDFVADLVDEAAGLLADEDARRRRVEGWDDELPSDLAHLLGASLPEATDPERWLQAQDLAIELVAGDES